MALVFIFKCLLPVLPAVAGLLFWKKQYLLNYRRTLDKMKIKIKKHDGTVVAPAETANSNTVSLLFEITTLQ